MIETSLIYVERDGKYLMLHRTKKEHDLNKDKWIGIGGKFEEGESPFDCAKREMKEETGLTPERLHYRGIVTFVSEGNPTEYMHLFTVTEFVGKLITDCNEGDLTWIGKKDLYDLTLWEGDRIFLKLIETPCPFFSLKLCYNKENALTSHTIDYEG